MATPKKTGEIQVTQNMLAKTKQELKYDIATVRSEIKSAFKSVDSRFNKVDARFDQMESRFEKMQATMDSMLAAQNRTNAIVEEQNSRNVFVLDGYTFLYDEQADMKRRIENIEKIFFGKGQT